MQCPFCLPALDPSQVILKNTRCRFLRPPEPVLVGSGLIIPRQHRETVFDLTAGEWRDTFALLQPVKPLLDREHAPDGYNIGWNCGRASGQEVSHAHLHVIPRFRDGPFAGKGIRYWLKQEANRRCRYESEETQPDGGGSTAAGGSPASLISRSIRRIGRKEAGTGAEPRSRPCCSFVASELPTSG